MEVHGRTSWKLVVEVDGLRWKILKVYEIGRSKEKSPALYGSSWKLPGM